MYRNTSEFKMENVNVEGLSEFVTMMYTDSRIANWNIDIFRIVSFWIIFNNRVLSTKLQGNWEQVVNLGRNWWMIFYNKLTPFYDLGLIYKKHFQYLHFK